MSVIKWSPFNDPFADFDKVFDDMRAMSVPASRGIVPPVDMYETKEAVVVETPIPGVEPGKLDVSIDNGILTIKGSSERKTEVDDKNYYRKEVRQGTVFRQVALPTAVDGTKAQASFENGILKIHVPKLGGQKESIKVEVKKK
jgi:HSP20 family protein